MNTDLVVIILFIVLLKLGVDGCRNCTQNEFVMLQEACKDTNEELNRATSTYANKNESSLCSYLFDFYYCVGEHVPECLSKITEGYSSYSSSPYDCHPPPEVTLKLQSYHIKAQDCSKTPTKESETTVGYSIITSTLNSSHAEEQNSTNSAGLHDVTVGTFLVVLSSALSWYL